MKAVILISTFAGAQLSGETMACRQTFVRDIAQFPNLTYRFFTGDGTPASPADDKLVLASFDEPWSSTAYKAKAIVSTVPVPKYKLRPTDIVLPVPDDYIHMVNKVREQYLWAWQQGFDYAFWSASDIYIHVPRLHQDFLELNGKQYVGRAAGPSHPAAQATYASGGGYWVGRNALFELSNAPVDIWASDLWTGKWLAKAGIYLHHDERYAANYPVCPHSGNSYITTHLGPCQPGQASYDPMLMFDVHQAAQK